MKYKCLNTKCEAFDVEVPIYRERMRFVDGKLVATMQPCPKCGELRQAINPDGMTTYMRGIDGPKG